MLEKREQEGGSGDGTAAIEESAEPSSGEAIDEKASSSEVDEELVKVTGDESSEVATNQEPESEVANGVVRKRRGKARKDDSP